MESVLLEFARHKEGQGRLFIMKDMIKKLIHAKYAYTYNNAYVTKSNTHRTCLHIRTCTYVTKFNTHTGYSYIYSPHMLTHTVVRICDETQYTHTHTHKRYAYT